MSRGRGESCHLSRLADSLTEAEGVRQPHTGECQTEDEMASARMLDDRQMELGTQAADEWIVSDNAIRSVYQWR